MAENESITKILDIKINYADAVKSIAEYNKKLDECRTREEALKKAFKDGQITEEEYRETITASRQVRKEYTEAIRETEKEMQNEIKKQKENEGSLRSLRAELSNATKAYDMLSREERNGAKGKEMMEHISAITEELKRGEEETGRFYRNVGNYENSIKSVFGNNALAQSLAGTKNAIIGVKGAMDLTAKTPLLAIVSLLVTVFQKLFSSAGKNEEQMVKLRKIMQPLSVVMDVVTNIVEKMADALLSVSSVIVDLGSKFLDYIGITEGANAKMREYIALEEAKANVIKNTRRLNEESAKTELETSELRAKVAQKDKYTASERKAMLETVIAKEKKIADDRKKLAEENLRILEEEGARTKNSAEFEEKLSVARIAVIKATTDYNNKTRELNGQMAELNAQEIAQSKALADKKRVIEEKRLKDLEDQRSKEKKAIQEAEDAMLDILSDGLLKQQALINTSYDRQIETLRERLAKESNLTVEAKEALNQKIIALEIKRNQELESASMEQAQKDADKRAKELEEADKAEQAYKAMLQEALDNEKAISEQRIKVEQARFQAMADITGGLSALLEAAGEDSKILAKASKVLALAEIAINTGKAISAGVAQAQSVPFPANIGAVATTVTTILTNMATAIKSVKSAKFSEGGSVNGSGTGTSDSVPAMLSDGESVLTAKATSMFAPLLSSLNIAGGGVPINVSQTGNQMMGEEMLARAVAKGVQMIPTPVVSVKEINDVSNRVAVLENIGNF